jgi:hypothetical protein
MLYSPGVTKIRREACVDGEAVHYMPYTDLGEVCPPYCCYRRMNFLHRTAFERIPHVASMGWFCADGLHKYRP